MCMGCGLKFQSQSKMQAPSNRNQSSLPPINPISQPPQTQQQNPYLYLPNLPFSGSILPNNNQSPNNVLSNQLLTLNNLSNVNLGLQSGLNTNNHVFSNVINTLGGINGGNMTSLGAPLNIHRLNNYLLDHINSLLPTFQGLTLEQQNIISSLLRLQSLDHENSQLLTIQRLLDEWYELQVKGVSLTQGNQTSNESSSITSPNPTTPSPQLPPSPQSSNTIHLTIIPTTEQTCDTDHSNWTSFEDGNITTPSLGQTDFDQRLESSSPIPNKNTTDSKQTNQNDYLQALQCGIKYKEKENDGYQNNSPKVSSLPPKQYDPKPVYPYSRTPHHRELQKRRIDKDHHTYRRNNRPKNPYFKSINEVSSQKTNNLSSVSMIPKQKNKPNSPPRTPKKQRYQSKGGVIKIKPQRKKKSNQGNLEMTPHVPVTVVREVNTNRKKRKEKSKHPSSPQVIHKHDRKSKKNLNHSNSQSILKGKEKVKLKVKSVSSKSIDVKRRQKKDVSHCKKSNRSKSQNTNQSNGKNLKISKVSQSMHPIKKFHSPINKGKVRKNKTTSSPCNNPSTTLSILKKATKPKTVKSREESLKIPEKIQPTHPKKTHGNNKKRKGRKNTGKLNQNNNKSTGLMPPSKRKKNKRKKNKYHSKKVKNKSKKSLAQRNKDFLKRIDEDIQRTNKEYEQLMKQHQNSTQENSLLKISELIGSKTDSVKEVEKDLPFKPSEVMKLIPENERAAYSEPWRKFCEGVNLFKKGLFVGFAFLLGSKCIEYSKSFYQRPFASCTQTPFNNKYCSLMGYETPCEKMLRQDLSSMIKYDYFPESMKINIQQCNWGVYPTYEVQPKLSELDTWYYPSMCHKKN